jgi:hypothetical protein
MLSSSASDKLKQLRGTERSAVEAMLDRVRNPLVRAHKKHSFHGTDLDVYKPGRTGHRLAYWAKGDRVYVAEIYASHDQYENQLPGCRKQDYPSVTFTQYFPSPSGLYEAEPSKDEAMEIAQRDVERSQEESNAVRRELRAAQEAARSEVEEALRLAGEAADRSEQMEQMLERQTMELEEVRRSIIDLKRTQQEIASWGIWRRLQWALFGRPVNQADVVVRPFCAREVVSQHETAGRPPG